MYTEIEKKLTHSEIERKKLTNRQREDKSIIKNREQTLRDKENNLKQLG